MFFFCILKTRFIWYEEYVNLEKKYDTYVQLDECDN